MSQTLTERQERFIAAFVGEANFNATEAARIAGYSAPRQSASENLSNANIKARINAILDQIRDEGIGNKAVRLAELSDMNEKLKIVERGYLSDALQAIEQGEDVPQAALSGLMKKETKIGTGSNAVVITEWVIDKTLVQERRNILEQAAKEVGDRDRRLVELTGKDGGPVEVLNAKVKLEELLDG